MTSAGGNVTYLSRGENKLNYHRPLILRIFADFLFENCGFFNHRFPGIPKDNKIGYNNFFGKFYFTSGSLDRFDLQKIPGYARDILQAKLVSGTLWKVRIL